MPKDTFFSLPTPVQDKVLLAAAELMIERGPRSVKLEDVAQKIKVEKAALDRYFDGMNDVIAAVLGGTIQHFNETYIQVGKLEKPFWERVEFLLRAAAERGFRLAPMFNFYYYMGGCGMMEMAQATYDRFEGRAALFFQNLVLSGVQEGALRDDVDVAATAMHFQLTTRMSLARRAHPLFRARSRSYFPELPLDDAGDRRLVHRMVAYLKSLYAAR